MFQYSKWRVTGVTNLVLSHSSSSTYCAWSVPRQNAVPMTMRYRDCWRRPWTGISWQNASDQATGRMVQGQRNRSLKRRRLAMCLSLQSPLTLQKVTVTDIEWLNIVCRPNVILTLSIGPIFTYIDNQLSGKLVLCCIFYNKLYSNIVWQFSSTWNLGILAFYRFKFCYWIRWGCEYCLIKIVFGIFVLLINFGWLLINLKSWSKNANQFEKSIFIAGI